MDDIIIIKIGTEKAGIIIKHSSNWLSSAAIILVWGFACLFLWLFFPYGLIFWLPAILLYIYVKSGRVTAGVCALTSVLCMTLYLGIYGGVAMAIMLAPAAVALFMIQLKRKFWESVYMMAGVLFGATLLTLCLGYLVVGEDLIDAGMRFVFGIMRGMDTQMIDAVLSPLSMLGVIGPGAEMVPVPFEVRETLLVQLEGVMAELLRNDMPSIIIVGCGFGGLLGTFLPRLALRKQGNAEADFPDIFTWRLQKQTRDGISIVFLATFLGTLMGITFLADVYDTVCDIVFFICAVQGVAVSEFYLRFEGFKKTPRHLLISAVTVFFRTVMTLIGIIDMFFNIRLRVQKAALGEGDNEDSAGE